MVKNFYKWFMINLFAGTKLHIILEKNKKNDDFYCENNTF